MTLYAADSEMTHVKALSILQVSGLVTTVPSSTQLRWRPPAGGGA